MRKKDKDNPVVTSGAPPVKTEIREIDCILTDEEITERAHTMSKAFQAKDEILIEFKQVKSEYKSKIEAQDSIISNCANAINNGTEKREVTVKIHLNEPNSGVKTIVRTDTGEETTEDMTPDELQEELELYNNN